MLGSNMGWLLFLIIAIAAIWAAMALLTSRAEGERREIEETKEAADGESKFIKRVIVPNRTGTWEERVAFHEGQNRIAREMRAYAQKSQTRETMVYTPKNKVEKSNECRCGESLYRCHQCKSEGCLNSDCVWSLGSRVEFGKCGFCGSTDTRRLW